MKIKFIVLFSLLLSFSYSNAAKYKYWLVIKDSAFVYKDGKGTKYVYPQKDYTYMVKTNSNIQGSGVGNFTIKVSNGKKSGDTSTQFDVNENIEFSVQWNDMVDTCNVFVKDKKPYFGDTLNPVSPIRFSYRIASLKGQTPVIGISSNPPIGNKQNITAQIITEATYPNLYMPYNILTGWVNIPAEYYVWTLPPNWTAAGQNGNTFIIGAQQKSITITPDNVTSGEIKVRALNTLKTAGSETKSNALDRGLAYTAYPTSITFGDNSQKTFTVTPFNGVTYEWSVPSNWKINGQGNTFEGLNQNSINVTPDFCPLTDAKVKVRLKKDGDVSQWYDFPSYTGVAQPTISSATETIYQYENVDFSLSNIFAAGINSISWSGDGVLVQNNQGANSKITFTKSGPITLMATILMNGCSASLSIPKTITVNPNRLSMTGSSEVCNSEQYNINNLAAENTVAWSAVPSGIVTIQQNENSATFTKVSSGIITISALINNCFTITKDIRVGSPYYLGISGISNLTDWDSNTFKVLPGGGYYAYEGTLSLSDDVGLATSYKWTLSSSTPGKSVSWWPTGSSVDVAMKTTDTNLTLKCTASNSCGSYYQYYTFTTGDMQPMIIAPNPSSDQAEISISDDTTTAASSLTSTSTSKGSSTNGSYRVTVIDSNGLTVYSGSKTQSRFNISTSSFRNGVYTVIVSNGSNTYQNKLIVKH